MLSLPFSQNCCKPKRIWRRVGRTTSAPTTFVFEHNTSSHGPGTDRPRAFGLPLAHWRSTPGVALLQPLQGNATSGVYVGDGRPIRSRTLQKDCGFSVWHSVSTGTPLMALSLLGNATASFSDDYDTAREMVDRAVALNPNSSTHMGTARHDLPHGGAARRGNPEL